MFEKEAEDSFNCKKVLYKWETDKHSYIDGFKDGAEFGYNKANEWHDLRKDPSDLPNDYRYVWTNVGASYYDSSDQCWRDEFGRTQGVIAWCEPVFEE